MTGLPPVPDTWRIGDRISYQNPNRKWRITSIHRKQGLVTLEEGHYRHPNLPWKQVYPVGPPLQNLSEMARKGAETRKRRQEAATTEASGRGVWLYTDVADTLNALELTGVIKDRQKLLNTWIRRELDKLLQKELAKMKKGT